MKVTLWGVRGSLPTPGPATAGYGGNTACVSVVATGRSMVVLDAGTGISPLGHALPDELDRVDILLSHLHMDHILGLGFFSGFYREGLEVHVWGPASTVNSLRERLARYLSPPLFPVSLRELPCRLSLHDVPFGTFELPGLSVTAGLVCHPGATVGYRMSDGAAAVTYLPDHEPALGARHFPDQARWTSGHALADGVELLIHDAQYTDDEYSQYLGWGHSSVAQALAFAHAAGVGHMVAFHHDPSHSDERLDALYGSIDAELTVTPARESASFVVGGAGDGSVAQA